MEFEPFFIIYFFTWWHSFKILNISWNSA